MANLAEEAPGKRAEEKLTQAQDWIAFVKENATEQFGAGPTTTENAPATAGNAQRQKNLTKRAGEFFSKWFLGRK